MAQQTPQDVIKRYLQDAIAAEETFEKHLRDFADDTDRDDIKQLFLQHADQSKWQHDQLVNRLRALGGSPSGFKSFMAGIFGLGPKSMQLGHASSEKLVQDLIMAYAVEHSEIAMYESLIAACGVAGDTETANLARQIQDQERATAQKVWGQIRPCAEWAYQDVTGLVPTRKAA
ncbi:MAG: DUF892 family protein [Armatimonadetes bacterium]|nr:DUF892 family protein [Armatimonadota bacterium]